MPHYRRRTQVEARVVSVANLHEIAEWTKGRVLTGRVSPTEEWHAIMLPPGTGHLASVGDYIVKGPSGHLSVYSSPAFHERYDEIPEG